MKGKERGENEGRKRQEASKADAEVKTVNDVRNKGAENIRQERNDKKDQKDQQYNKGVSFHISAFSRGCRNRTTCSHLDTQFFRKVT